LQILETVKSHPYATGAVVIGAGAVLLFLTRNNDDDSGNVYDGGYMVSGPSDAQVAAGTALQVASMEAASYREEIAGQTRLAEITAGAAIEAENIKANSAFNLAQMAADLQTLNINKSAETSQQSNVLTAMIAEKTLGLETLRVNEASKNTALQVAAARDVALYDRTLDFKTDQKALGVVKKLGFKELQVTAKLGKKQLDVAKKLGKLNTKAAVDINRNNNTTKLVGGILNGVFGIAGKVVNKTNTAAKTSYMPVETKKKKGKK